MSSRITEFTIGDVKFTNPFTRQYHENIQRLFEKQEDMVWTSREIKFDKDVVEFKTLQPGERFYVGKITSFFLITDDAIGKIIGSRLIDEVDIDESKSFFKLQEHMENVHAKTYKRTASELFPTTEEQDELLEEAIGWKDENVDRSNTAISKKIRWCTKWITSDKPLGERLIAMTLVELVLFSSSFAGIYWFKSRGKLPGLSFSNEKISVDEKLHGIHDSVAYITLVVEKKIEAVDNEVIYAMTREVVDAECEFVRECLPEPMLDISAEKMCQYVKFAADVALSFLDVKPLYGDKNPFPFMDLLSLTGKTDFFVRQVSEYLTGFREYKKGDNIINKFTLTPEDDIINFTETSV